MSFRLLASFAVASIACVSSPAFAEEAFKGDPYTLPTDPVTGEALPAKPIVVAGPNGEVRFANEKNAEAFKVDPAKYTSAIDAAIVKQQADAYPLEVCAVSGEKLGGMGEPVSLVVDNRLVKLCCKGCVDEAKKEPAKVFKKLDDAVIAKQKPTYPLATCVVSTEKLGGEAIDVVIGVKFLRVCCADCVDTVKEQPLKWLAKLDDATK